MPFCSGMIFHFRFFMHGLRGGQETESRPMIKAFYMSWMIFIQDIFLCTGPCKRNMALMPARPAIFSRRYLL